jgi:hypothetical protein
MTFNFIYNNKERKIMKYLAIKHLCLVGASVIALNLSCSGVAHATDTSGNKVLIDCYDGEGNIDNTDTNNTITVIFYKDGKEIGRDSEKDPHCTSLVDAPFGQSAGKADEIIIQTDGTDAFWMDEIILKNGGDRGEGGTNALGMILDNSKQGMITAWGDTSEDRMGWCLSLDPTDSERSWKNHVFKYGGEQASGPACYSAIKFFVGGSFEPTTPVSVKKDFKVEVDCYDSSMENEDTNDKITATFFDGSKNLGSKTLSDDCGWDVDGDAGITAKGYVTDIVLKTNGSDGFWMDHVDYFMNKDMKKRWGGDGGKGFCLSTDPKDGTRSWKNKVDGCYKAIRFNVKSGEAYPY